MRTLIAITGLAAVLPGIAQGVTCVGDDCVINNGLAPPNPENVINDSTYEDYIVYVRNVGCPPEWPSGDPTDPCPSPGAPTEVELMDGGTIWGGLFSGDTSTVTMSGGELTDLLSAADSSTVCLVGRDFEVDGAPVPYGDLTAQTGTLTGTLASGDSINSVFEQGGGDYTGTITLAEPPQVPALSPWSQLGLVGGLIGAGLVVWRRRTA